MQSSHTLPPSHLCRSLCLSWTTTLTSCQECSERKEEQQDAKIGQIMAAINQNDSIANKRNCTLQALAVYPNKDPAKLVYEYTSRSPDENQAENATNGHWHLCDQKSRCRCWSASRRCWHHCWMHTGALGTQRCQQCLCTTVWYHLQPEPELPNRPQVHFWIHPKDHDGAGLALAFSKSPGTQKQTAGLNAAATLLLPCYPVILEALHRFFFFTFSKEVVFLLGYACFHFQKQLFKIFRCW